MNKLFSKSIITLGLIAAISPLSLSAEKLTEIRLVDNIDEPRGYCLDIAGGRGKDAPLNKGLQAHTCYDYSGSLLEDQSFDTSLINKSEFKIPYFNVCMTASSLKEGSAVVLASCENKDTQKFSFKQNGNITLDSKPNLCLSVSSTKKKYGRGGSPVHIMRPLSLQTCSDDTKTYQTWKKFSL